MANVEFEEENTIQRSYGTTKTSGGGLSGWLMRKGLAKTASQATAIQLLILGACLAATAGIWISQNSDQASSAELERMDAWMRAGNLGAPPPSFMP